MRCGLHPIVSALALALAQSYVQVGLQPLLSSMLDNNTWQGNIYIYLGHVWHERYCDLISAKKPHILKRQLNITLRWHWQYLVIDWLVLSLSLVNYVVSVPKEWFPRNI